MTEHLREDEEGFCVEFGTEQITAVNAGVVTGKLQQMASGFVIAPKQLHRTRLASSTYPIRLCGSATISLTC